MTASPLEPPENLLVREAQGWVELGDQVEAGLILAKVDERFSQHPDVLKVRWGICAADKKWDDALALAVRLVELEPEEPVGWVHRSFCLHELKRTEEARDQLLRVVEKFPVSATIPYNLACYECQLGNLNEARKWLATGLRMSNRKQMILAALEDPDLKPLWDELRTS